MKKITRKWLAVLLVSFCFCTAAGMEANAGIAKEKVAYRIIDSNSGKPIEVEDGSNRNGALLVLGEESFGKKNQIFFLDTMDGRTVIKAAHTLNFVTVKKSSFKDGAEIVQWENENLASMKWEVIENDNDTVSFKNHNSGKMLDVTGGKTSKGTPLQQYEKDDSDSQKFILQKVPLEEVCQANLDATDTIPTTSSKVYRVVNAHSKKVLDVADMSEENGAKIQLWSSTKGNENQMFRIRTQDDGFYALVALHSGKAIEVNASSKEAGATLNQNTYLKDYSPQMWKLVALDDKRFILCSNNSGLVADVYNGLYSNGQQIVQFNFNGSDAQIFYLEEVSRKEYE